ncbi:MAG TPA: cation transporter [Gammaproteobacteria bacterium]|nr:cation transporter [Gammaproteobacteria bacterium]
MTDAHTHIPVNGSNEDPQRYRDTLRVTLVGSVLDLLLGVGKILVGFFSQSQALIADGVHSLSDLATDVLVLYAAKHASRAADEDHPYGHGRIETIATVALGGALILVAAALAFDAVRRLFEPDLLWHPGQLALLVAAISIVSKEAIYHYTMVYARKYRSNLLKANAWHSRSDAISSIIVLVGVLGSMAGLVYLDAIAAVGVALMIAKIGWDLAWHGAQELVDRGLDPERVERIRQLILSVDGVEQLHLLRTRSMGSDALVDVHIQVDPRLSVSEGHQISETVRRKLIAEMEEVADVMVHIDPEDDEKGASCGHLPLREAILDELAAQWADIPAAEKIRDVTLHYLDGKIYVDLVLPLDLVQNQPSAREELERRFSEAAQKAGSVAGIQLYYQ